MVFFAFLGQLHLYQNDSCKRSALVMDTFFTFQACPFTGPFTVILLPIPSLYNKFQKQMCQVINMSLSTKRSNTLSPTHTSAVTSVFVLKPLFLLM